MVKAPAIYSPSGVRSGCGSLAGRARHVSRCSSMIVMGLGGFRSSLTISNRFPTCSIGEIAMAISASKAARRLCELSGWTVTNLELNKLLYFAQMIALGEKRESLVNGHFEAWDFGPVLPDVYHNAKIFGNKPVKPFLFGGRGPVEGWEPVFDRTMKAFGGLTGGQLVAESHWSKGAWAKHYRPGARGVQIPNDDIAAEYRKRTA